MRVTVLGGTGFIGRHVARQLLEAGADVTTVERGTSGDHESVARSLTADRNDAAALKNALATAAPTVVIDMIAYQQRDIAHLVSAMPPSASRLVVISSGDVYATYGAFLGQGDRMGMLQSNEQAKLRTELFPYRRQARGPDDWLFSYEKILVERAAMAWHGGAATILRLPMVYGPDDRQERVAKYIEKFRVDPASLRLNSTQATWRCTRGYVEDVAAAIVLAALSEAATGQILNVGELEALTEVDWARAIARHAGWHGEIVIDPAAVPERNADWTVDLVVDTSRIRRLLGFTEPYGLDVGLQRTVSRLA